MTGRLPFPGWLAAALRTLGILLVLGVVSAVVLVQHGTTVEAVEVVEVVEDLEPDAATLIASEPDAKSSARAVASGSLARPIRAPATRPDVPPPRA